jgi:hypothetical protein
MGGQISSTFLHCRDGGLFIHQIEEKLDEEP